jgi:hypothetical protein
MLDALAMPWPSPAGANAQRARPSRRPRKPFANPGLVAADRGRSASAAISVAAIPAHRAPEHSSRRRRARERLPAPGDPVDLDALSRT